MEETNWMFRLQKYKPQLLDFLTAHPDWLKPTNFYKDIVRTIEESTQDLSVSRPLSRVPWAIPTHGRNREYDLISDLINGL